MIVNICYTVPVYVTIDTDEETVTKVLQDNSDLKPWTKEVYDENDVAILDREIADKAWAIAENTEWPAWDR